MTFDDLVFGPHPVATSAQRDLEGGNFRGEISRKISEMHASAIHAVHQFDFGWAVSVISHKVPEGVFRSFYGNLDEGTYEVLIMNETGEHVTPNGDEGPLGWQTKDDINHLLNWIESHRPKPPPQPTITRQTKRGLDL